VDALVSYIGYLEKVFGPKDLTVLYPHPFSLPAWQIAVSALLLIAISAATLLGRRKFPFLAVGWFWFLVALVPAMAFDPIKSQFMADHFVYIPLIGLFIALAWTISLLLPRFAFTACSLVAVGACLFISSSQLKYWKNSTALFSHAVDINPQNPIAQNSLADALVEQGDYDAAKARYEQTLRLKPDYVEAHYNYGNLLNARAEMEQAVVHLATAVRLKPQVPELHNNLGNALARKGEMQKAIVEFNEAVRLKPDFARAEYNLGLAYSMIEQPQESLTHYSRAVQLAPTDPDVHKNLANLFLKLNKLSEANDHYAAYLKLQPDDIKTRCRYAMVLRQAGKPEGAVEQLREVIRLQPDAVDPLTDLAWILAAHPKTEIRNGAEAVRLAERASEITKGKDINCLNILAAAYAEAGRFQEAITTSKKLREQLVASGQKDLLPILDQRLALYEAGKPFHQEN
jgi:protein O-mannosyl-transferase